MALGVALVSGWPAAASAWQVGNWFGRSVLTDTGSFAGCRMSASYDSGITLHVLQLSKGTLLIGMSGPSWSLEPNGAYRMGLTVDGRFVVRARGVVLSGVRETLFLDLGRDPATRTRLRNGAQLSLADGARAYDFRLTNVAEALARLDACVRNSGREGG
jgi:hypothetical protein